MPEFPQLKSQIGQVERIGGSIYINVHTARTWELRVPYTTGIGKYLLRPCTIGIWDTQKVIFGSLFENTSHFGGIPVYRRYFTVHEYVGITYCSTQ